MSVNAADLKIKTAKKLKQKIHAKQAKRDAEQAKRAYKQFQEVQNIDIEEQSNTNWNNLQTRLRNPQDPTNPLTEEMRMFLTEKLKLSSKEVAKKQKISPKEVLEILTSEEKIFLHRLVVLEGSKWELRHATRDYATIESSGNLLLSLEERKRRGMSIDNRHTND